MATIENSYTGDGSTVLFSFTFEYIEEVDIEVSIDAVTLATTEYSLANSTTIEFNTAPTSGAAIRIYRNTTVNDPKATFFPGSAIRAQDLNDNFEQILFVTQEADAISERAETAADAAQIATTAAQTAAASANTAGAAAQASATAAQSSATSAQTSATTAAAEASQASTDAAAALATASTADTNASNAVSTANAASALIATAVLADGTRAMTGDLNVDSNKVVNLANPTAGGDAVNKTFADANYQPLDAELTELATMQGTTASALADLTQAEVRVLDGATLSTNELNTLDGITASTTELNKLDGATVTANELNVLDGVTATTTELNVTDGLTASTAEINQLDGKTISSTLTPANTNDIPTSSAVNTFVSGLLNSLGGFVAIANEISFPTTNPDPSDNAGTVVSIADAGGVVVDASGVSATGRTTGNATVTINGFPSSLQSTTLGAGLGLQVQTTTTLNTYTYHKLIAKETDVVQLSDDINDFNERYRVSANAPTTDLDAGDLWFDTTAGKMKVYDANDSAWEEVQSVGNFSINTLSSSSATGGGSATFNGSAYRFTLSNAGANAQQMLVSVNGVIQKPNSGTSQPSEGFAIDTNDIIFAAAPASGASQFIVTIGSTVNIGQPSNNTVDTSELVDGAVNNAKVSSSAAIAGTKINPDFGSQNLVTTGSADFAGDCTFANGRVDAFTSSDNGVIRLFNSSAAQKIQLNGTDGSATLASTTTVGGSALNGGAAGVQLYPTGGIHATQASGTSTVLSGYIQGSSTKNVAITAAGNATFAGSIEAVLNSTYKSSIANNGTIALYGANGLGTYLDNDGSASFAHFIQSTRFSTRGALGVNVNGTDYAFAAFDASSNLKASVDLGGSATFASGNVQLSSGAGVKAISSSGASSQMNGDGIYQMTTGGASAASILANGSATFAEEVISSGKFGSNRTSGTLDCFSANLNGNTNAIIRADGNIHVGGNIGSSPNIQLTASGTATFASTIISQGDAGGGANDGSRIDGQSGFSASFNSSTSLIYRGYTTGSSTPTFSVQASGNAVFAGSVTAAGGFSDIRFKENITDANPQLADAVALGSQLKNWDWKDNAPLNEELRAKRFLGLVAQEAEKVCPGLTYTIPRTKQGKELTAAVLDEEGNETKAATYEELDDSFKAINHDILVMKLLGAVAEQNTQIEALKTQNASLEARLTALEGGS